MTVAKVPARDRVLVAMGRFRMAEKAPDIAANAGVAVSTARRVLEQLHKDRLVAEGNYVGTWRLTPAGYDAAAGAYAAGVR